MAKRKWEHQLDASKQEALLAVDLYNRAGQERHLEAFILHMHLAWLYLLHADFERRDIDCWYRDSTGKKAKGKDGEPRAWELSRCMKEAFKENDPIRRNVEFFIGIRDKIEHRFERALGPVIAGKSQSHVLNYEETLVQLFGRKQGLADQLRFPVFLSALSEDAVAALKRTYDRLPAKITRYVEAFEGALPEAVRDDSRYEFRVTLVPQTGPRSESDVAMRFIRWDDLTEDQQGELEKMQTIIREKREPHDSGSCCSVIACSCRPGRPHQRLARLPDLRVQVCDTGALQRGILFAGVSRQRGAPERGRR